MSWIIYSIFAIFIISVSDIFRKLASNLRDPIVSNLFFQIGAFSSGILMYLLFSQKALRPIDNSKTIYYALIGGFMVSIFSMLSFKALSTGPGVSVVMPVLRIGSVALVALLGVVLLKERLTLQSVLGLIFSTIGIYLLFSSG